MIAAAQILLPIAALVALVSFVLLLVSSFRRHLGWGLAVLLVPFAIPVYGIRYWREVKRPFAIYMISNTLCLALVAVYFNTLGGSALIRMADGIRSGTLTEQDAAQFMTDTMAGLEEVTGENVRASTLAEMRQDGRVSADQIAQVEHLFDQIEGLAAGEVERLEEPRPRRAAPEAGDADAAGGAAFEPGPESAPGRAAPVQTIAPPPLPSSTISTAEAGRHVGRFMLIATKNGIERKAMLSEVTGGKLVFAQLHSGGSLEFTLDPAEVESLKLVTN